MLAHKGLCKESHILGLLCSMEERIKLQPKYDSLGSGEPSLEVLCGFVLCNVRQ